MYKVHNVRNTIDHRELYGGAFELAPTSPFGKREVLHPHEGVRAALGEDGRFSRECLINGGPGLGLTRRANGLAGSIDHDRDIWVSGE
jgi:hypothetical protein